jgi:DNA replication and repair protein RecF
VHLDSVDITGFRNFASSSTLFSPGKNLLFGPNGSGKSNLLETIHYLCTAKSFRSATDDLIVHHGADFFRIVGEGKVGAEPVTIELAYRPGEKKRIKINSVLHSKVAVLYRQFKVVFFGPDDVELVYGPPSVRRRFLDISIAQLEAGYIPLLWEYKKVVAQRNALLRELGEAYDSLGAIGGDESLQVWNEKLVELGLAINGSRARFIREVSELAGGYHNQLTTNDDRLEIRYKASPTLDEYSGDAYRAKLESRRTRELLMRQSMYGPHRDDLQFLLSGDDCRSYASRGQVKSAVLSVKLAVLEHVRKLCEESPILLLDEIFSDLDKNRLDCLMPMLEDLGQVIITTSKLGEVKELSMFENLLRVDDGSIEKYTP